MIVMWLIMVSSCTPMRVGFDFDPTADLSRYRAYAWGSGDADVSGDPRLDANPFFDSRVRSAVEQQLVAKGFQKVSPDSAELLINYHAAICERVDVLSVNGECGYEDSYETRVIEYDEGTLILDIAEARTGKVVWRGWAQTNVDHVFSDPRLMEERIQEATRRLFERFPPGS